MADTETTKEIANVREGKPKRRKLHTFAESYPEMAKEWDYEKNGGLTPDDVSEKSGYRAHWRKDYYDERQDTWFPFTWEATVADRAYGHGECPYLSARCKRAWPGFNDLESQYPELAEEYDRVKNEKIPSEICMRSDVQVWWRRTEISPETGERTVVEWQEGVRTRVDKFEGAKRLEEKGALAKIRKSKAGESLADRYPEIATMFNVEKNGGLTPDVIRPGSTYRAWWKKEYTDGDGNTFLLEWQRTVVYTVKTKGRCPVLSADGKGFGNEVCKGFNDLATLYPELAAQFDEAKNGGLTAADVTPKSSKKVWWKEEKKGEKAGETVTMEWQETVCSRVKKEEAKRKGKR